jgi:hypothetical protein
MNEMYIGNIEAFPTYEKVLISFSSMDEGDDGFYEMELPREEKALTSLFKKLKILTEPTTPCQMFTQFTRDVLRKNVGSFYVPKENINSVISHYRANVPDQSKLANTQPIIEPLDLFITESFILKADALINDSIIGKGKRIYFYYEGNI